MAAIFHAARQVDGMSWEMTTTSLEADIRALGHRPEETILLAERDGRLAGFTRVFDFGLSPDEGRMLMHAGHVHPDWRGRGLGRALLAGAHAELTRIRALRPDPPGSTAGFACWVAQGNGSTKELLAANGYRRLRYVIEMERGLDDLPEIDLPAGLTTRPVRESDRLAVIRALDEAMRDHRGWPAMTDDALVELFDHPIRGQLDVWQVAWDGDRVVGGVLGYIDEDENAAMNRRRGWTEGIFTVRDWRGRGVASAMIARSLRLLCDRGMTEAGLTVDTESPTGALALYERHGFRECARIVIFRKELERAI
jgi:GNAT superfamily N-acetyltransferase